MGIAAGHHFDVSQFGGTSKRASDMCYVADQGGALSITRDINVKSMGPANTEQQVDIKINGPLLITIKPEVYPFNGECDSYNINNCREEQFVPEPITEANMLINKGKIATILGRPNLTLLGKPGFINHSNSNQLCEWAIDYVNALHANNITTESPATEMVLLKTIFSQCARMIWNKLKEALKESVNNITFSRLKKNSLGYMKNALMAHPSYAGILLFLGGMCEAYGVLGTGSLGPNYDYSHEIDWGFRCAFFRIILGLHLNKKKKIM
jgi:hypothetical protein